MAGVRSRCKLFDTGRRERIRLVDAAGKLTILDENCMDAANALVQKHGLVLQCLREEVANALPLHSVLVFEAAGKKRAEIEHCRNPGWKLNASGENALTCEAESVDADGRLSLRRRPVKVQ